MRKIKTRKQIVDETMAGLKEAIIAHEVNMELSEKMAELGWEQQNAKRKVEIVRGQKMLEILKTF